jgi:hypothetical protein
VSGARSAKAVNAGAGGAGRKAPRGAHAPPRGCRARGPGARRCSERGSSSSRSPTASLRACVSYVLKQALTLVTRHLARRRQRRRRRQQQQQQQAHKTNRRVYPHIKSRPAPAAAAAGEGGGRRNGRICRHLHPQARERVRLQSLGSLPALLVQEMRERVWAHVSCRKSLPPS